MQRRVNLEQAALLRFEDIARRFGLRVFKGQVADNRIPIGGNLYFQFGDLRIDTSTHHVVVEVESAGGVTNLVKYWYCLTDNTLSKHISKPIILLYVFRQISANDYGSHLALWSFLWYQMQEAIGDRIQAFRYTYRELSDLEPATRKFESNIVLH